MKIQLYIASLITMGITACSSVNENKFIPIGSAVGSIDSVRNKPLAPTRLASAKEILEKVQVPILCYHRIRPFKQTDSKRAKDYIVTPDDFKAQMKLLADSGYSTILPDQLVGYLQEGKPIPPKSVMLTFDDNVVDQIEVARPVLQKYGFKGVYFIMTVTLGKPGYMSREQVKQLHNEGNVIGSHTYDHQNMRKLPDSLWAVQVDKPQKQLKDITGAEVKYFAYPFGLWKPENIPALQKRDITAAFELTEKRDPDQPLYTIRRMIVPGEWTAEQMHRRMKSSFSFH